MPQCHLGVGGLSQRFAHLHGNHYLLSVCPAVTLNDKALLVVRRSFGFVEADVNRVWGRICKAGSIARRAVRRSARNSDRHGASAFFWWCMLWVPIHWSISRFIYRRPHYKLHPGSSFHLPTADTGGRDFFPVCLNRTGFNPV